MGRPHHDVRGPPAALIAFPGPLRDSVAVLEGTDVRVPPLGEVDLRHALDEGERYTTVAE